MINRISLLLTILLGVAFITLLERKLLRYSQSRKGPNLVGPLGLLQPFRDGLKLLVKQEPLWGNNFFISIPPILFWVVTLIFWSNLREAGSINRISFLWLMVFRSLGGILTFLTGWNGGRVYSVMGGIRASAQIVSYEVVLSFFFLMALLGRGQLNFVSLEGGYPIMRFSQGWFILLPLWLLSILAETNRAPFDLTEGESELVRGFNTEYAALSFTLLFLGEYAIILGFRIITSFLFFQTWAYSILFRVFILWIRRCFPRKRYDFLIRLMWGLIFPLLMVFIFIQVGAFFF